MPATPAENDIRNSLRGEDSSCSVLRGWILRFGVRDLSRSPAGGRMALPPTPRSYLEMPPPPPPQQNKQERSSADICRWRERRNPGRESRQRIPRGVRYEGRIWHREQRCKARLTARRSSLRDKLGLERTEGATDKYPKSTSYDMRKS